MDQKKTKILYMGEPIDEADLPDPGPAALEHAFAPVTLSAKAIDRCSQIVPEEHWKPLGLHTWLSGRADQAFKKLPVSGTEISLGRLKYVFEYSASGPVLKNLILI